MNCGLFILALTEFDVNPDIIANVLVFDGTNTPISTGLFEMTLMQFINCASFVVRLAIQSDSKEPALVQVSAHCVLF